MGKISSLKLLTTQPLCKEFNVSIGILWIQGWHEDDVMMYVD